MDEPEIIEALRQRLSLPAGALELRDDAALLREPPNVASTDMLVAGVHFDAAWASPADAGWKAAAACLSDLAAMGAEPVGLLWAVGAPSGEGSSVLEAAGGLDDCANRYRAPVYGGDTVASPVLVLAVTALGTARRPVRRDRARLGDLVGLTWPVGGAAAGLALLRGTEARLAASVRESLVRRQLRPEPRLAEGAALAAEGATAMVDLSDGLGLDLGHVAAASGVAVHVDLVPLQDGVTEVARSSGSIPEIFGLGGGDDYELAFTFPPDQLDSVEATGALVIGRVEAGEGVWWSGRRVDELGWRHSLG